MRLGPGGNIVYLFDAPEDIDNDVSFISQWDTPRTKYNVSAVTTPDVERYTPHGGCYGALLPSWNSQTLDRNPLNPYQQFWACQLVTSLP